MQRYIPTAMPTTSSCQLATSPFRLPSARTAKRWARRLVVVWLGIWLIAALQACNEAEAAVTAYEHVLGADCGHPAESGTGGGHQAAACLDIDEPTPASAESPAGLVAGNVIQLAPAAYAASHTLPRPAASSLTPAYRPAPAPGAIYLRTSRLLI